MENQVNNYENTAINVNPNAFAKTFFFMFLGLLATGIVSVYTYSSGLFATIITNGMFSVLLIVELVAVLLFSFLYRKLPYIAVELLYFIYAIINGITLSVIFYLYSLNSIGIIFFASAGLFALFALLGYTTKIDLTKISTILYGVLFLGIIVSVINVFLGNTLMDTIISWVMLFVFFGITAYDIQRIKYASNLPGLNSEKLYVYMAMQIYLDFINIFLRLLSIFGRRR